jgi:hypothetical protein
MSAEKTTEEKNFCPECSQSHNCRAVYQQLSNTKGPCIVTKALVAFLLPIVTFVAGLAIFDKALAGLINNQNLQTALSFLSAVGVSFVCVLVVKAIDFRPAKRPDSCKLEGEAISRPEVD